MANEKRLIDVNELEAHFHETKMIEIFPYWKELPFKTQSELVRFGKALKEMMQNAPTVDAVEVVRCGECRFVDTKECPMSGSSGRVSASDFCSYGERRTDNG